MGIIEKIENVISSLKNNAKEIISGKPENNKEDENNEYYDNETEAEKEGIINERKEMLKNMREMNNNKNNDKEFNR